MAGAARADFRPPITRRDNPQMIPFDHVAVLQLGHVYIVPRASPRDMVFRTGLRADMLWVTDKLQRGGMTDPEEILREGERLLTLHDARFTRKAT